MKYQKYDSGNGNELLLFTDKTENEYDEMLDCEIALEESGKPKCYQNNFDEFELEQNEEVCKSYLKAFNEEAYNLALANEKCTIEGKIYAYPVSDGENVQMFYIGADIEDTSEIFGIIDNYSSVVNAARE